MPFLQPHILCLVPETAVVRETTVSHGYHVQLKVGLGGALMQTTYTAVDSYLPPNVVHCLHLAVVVQSQPFYLCCPVKQVDLLQSHDSHMVDHVTINILQLMTPTII